MITANSYGTSSGYANDQMMKLNQNNAIITFCELDFVGNLVWIQLNIRRLSDRLKLFKSFKKKRILKQFK